MRDPTPPDPSSALPGRPIGLTLAFVPVLVLGVLLGAGIGVLASPAECTDAPTPSWCLLIQGMYGSMMPALLLLLVALRLGKGKAPIYLGGMRGPRRWGLGIAVGLALPLPALLVAWALGNVSIHTATDSILLAPTLAILAVAALSEELIFRGYLLGVLERWMPAWAALLVSSLAFGAAHAANPGMRGFSAYLLGLLGVAVAGLGLGLLTQRTGSLWASWGVHLAWNLSIGCLWGLPVSGLDLPSVMTSSIGGSERLWGGDFGPEAGLFFQLSWLLLLLYLASSAWRVTTDSGAAPSPK